MSEEVNVEEVVEEVVEEQQEPQEQGQEEQQQEAQEQPAQEPNLEMDFSNIIPESQPEPEPEPDYDLVIENVVNKVLDKQKIKLNEDQEDSDDDDVQYMSKKELAEYSKKIEQDVLGKIQQQQQAQQTINQSHQDSLRVRNTYAQSLKTKLAENGIDLESNPQMQMNADMLFNTLKLQYAASVGRPLKNPITGEIDPILTAQETGNLVKQHWDIYSKSYLSGGQQQVRANTAPLGAGNNSIPGQALPTGNQDYEQFMQKKAQGKETMGDAMSLLLKMKK